jgi:hypothetical protein
MTNGVLLQAALNGDRDHPAAPRTPDELAAEARAAVGTGAVFLHLHPYDDHGRETLGAGPCAAALRAVRAACPGVEARADCVFVPGVRDAETISALAREIAGPGSPPASEPAGLGVRRVSVGSGPSRAVRGLIRKMGQELPEKGTYASIAGGAIPQPEANRLFSVEQRQARSSDSGSSPLPPLYLLMGEVNARSRRPASRPGPPRWIPRAWRLLRPPRRGARPLPPPGAVPP